MANLAEHRIEMPVAAANGGKAATALPEKWLNRFVRVVASMERFGNALGTLAFTWATVVLLGGYPTVLRPNGDFVFATVIIFLEALRMFSRGNKLDYQLFFRTRGAFRSLGWNGMIWMVCSTNALMNQLVYSFILGYSWFGGISILVTGTFMCLRAPKQVIPNTLRRAVSLWSPMIAIILVHPPTYYTPLDEAMSYHPDSFTMQTLFVIHKPSVTMQTVYLILLISVLLLILTRLQFPSIIKLVDWALGRKIVFWRPVILNMSMVTAIVMFISTFNISYKVFFIIIDILVMLVVSLGNLQIPAAVLRIVVARVYGIPKVKGHYGAHGDEVNPGNMTNLDSSLYIFYYMVLGQGIFYIVASIFEIFLFILRKSLIRRAGFRGSGGVKYINLYYSYAFDKCMEGAVLGPVKTSLAKFAMDSLHLDSPKMQRYGLKMLHILLKKDPLKAKAISELTTSTKTMTCLVSMLGWTSERDKDIRSSAAMVIAEIANNLQFVHIPGAMQLIASLLDTVDVRENIDPLLDIGTRPDPKLDNPIQRVSRSEQTSPMLKWLKKMAKYCFIPREDPTNKDEQKPRILRFWKFSVSEEEPSTDVDLLPILGMLILDKLASFDLESCIEIYRETGLISKIIEFTTKRVDVININETHQELLKGSSLKLLRRLSSTEGKLGVTLRQKILEHPFILRNLSQIFDDNESNQELRELTAELVRNLAMDGNREEISQNRVIISRLMHAFLSQSSPSSTNSDQLLRMIAGQALAVLAIESANNCLAMLAEPGYAFIKELAVMIHVDRFRYIASSLLRNMCVHARAEFGDSDLKEVSYILREVLERIMDAEGAELEILVGLSSQICEVIPRDFAQELEVGLIKQRFIKRLVNALNSNMIPAAHCPGIRRVIVEHAISILECNPSCTSCFNKYWMMEALIMVEHTPTRVEHYRFFSGDAGLMKHSIPLSALVSRAKQLMSRE